MAMGLEALENELMRLGEQIKAGINGAIRRRFDDLLEQYRTVTAQSAKAVISEHMQVHTTTGARQVSYDIRNYLMTQELFGAKQRAEQLTFENIDFVFTIAVRAYRQRTKLAEKHWVAFTENLAQKLEGTMLERILQNIGMSFLQGGPFDDDLEKKSSWEPLSPKYVKKKGHSAFGSYSGKLMRTMPRGALTVHYHPRIAGYGRMAREFSIDFSHSESGRKLALFYFGRKSGRGKQPSRKFTFLRIGDMEILSNLANEHFTKAVRNTYEFFAGVRVGRMPTAVGAKIPRPRFYRTGI